MGHLWDALCRAYDTLGFGQDAGPASLVLYDVSTLYFETDAGDGFREPGLSEERRLDPPTGRRKHAAAGTRSSTTSTARIAAAAPCGR
jgi:hypothetical protein